MKLSFSSLFVVGAMGLVSIGCGDENTTPVDKPPTDVAPTIELTAIGSPTWEIVDHHQFATPLPSLSDFSEFYQLAKDLMPPPNHGWADPPVGIIPGDTHAGPYDNEFGAGVKALGLEEHTVYPVSDITVTSACLSVFMVTAKVDAPQGSSPDFASGAIMPNALFPMHFSGSQLKDGVLDPKSVGGFDIPAVTVVRPDLTVDGHSHYPMFRAVFPVDDSAGENIIEDTLVDTAGNGWKIKRRIVAY